MPFVSSYLLLGKNHALEKIPYDIRYPMLNGTLA